MAGRDIIIFNVLTGLAAVHYLLKTLGTSMEKPTWIYILMWAISLILLLWFRVYHGERGDPVDYDENLKRQHLPLLFLSVAAMVITIIINTLLVSSFARSALYVPRPNLALNLGATIPSIVDDVLYNFVLVANAEESIKLVGILALFRKTENAPLSIAVPIGFWAVLHAYQAYTGSLMPTLVFSAFVSGIILFLLLKRTESLQNAIIAHGLYNSLVILTTLIYP